MGNILHDTAVDAYGVGPMFRPIDLGGRITKLGDRITRLGAPVDGSGRWLGDSEDACRGDFGYPLIQRGAQSRTLGSMSASTEGPDEWRVRGWR
jgi:hypothetical protein